MYVLGENEVRERKEKRERETWKARKGCADDCSKDRPGLGNFPPKFGPAVARFVPICFAANAIALYIGHDLEV
jgi:hypothetical protein